MPVFSDITLDIEPFSAGVLTLGFIYGAYMTETFRGAILSIPRGQFEAAAAFGMRPVQAFVRITLPQLVRVHKLLRCGIGVHHSGTSVTSVTSVTSAT